MCPKNGSSRFEQSAFQVDLVSGRELVGHLYKFGIMMREVVEEIHKEKPEAFDGALTAITVKRDVIRVLSRRELGFNDDEPTCQSSESSATQGPVVRGPRIIAFHK